MTKKNQEIKTAEQNFTEQKTRLLLATVNYLEIVGYCESCRALSRQEERDRVIQEIEQQELIFAWCSLETHRKKDCDNCPLIKFGGVDCRYFRWQNFKKGK